MQPRPPPAPCRPWGEMVGALDKFMDTKSVLRWLREVLSSQPQHQGMGLDNGSLANKKSPGAPEREGKEHFLLSPPPKKATWNILYSDSRLPKSKKTQLNLELLRMAFDPSGGWSSTDCRTSYLYPETLSEMYIDLSDFVIKYLF